MTPQELINLHVIGTFEVTDENNEYIDYNLIPDYKTPGESQHYFVKYDEDNKIYYFGDSENTSTDKEDCEWFLTEQEAWIACAQENNIDTEYSEPYEHLMVTKWLYNRLKIKKAIISKHQNHFIWGRTYNAGVTYLDQTIQKIAKKESELQLNNSLNQDLAHQ